jgi:two-component system, OmpR family, sensor histidine kinase KdpD
MYSGAVAECVLVAIGPSPSSRTVLEGAADLARGLGARLVACTIQDSREGQRGSRDVLARHARRATALGAEILAVPGRNVAHQLLRVARERDAGWIVVGRTPRPARWVPWREDVVGGLMEGASPARVVVIGAGPGGGAERSDGARARRTAWFRQSPPPGVGRYFRMVAIMAVALALGMIIDRVSDRDANTIMVLLAGVLFTSTFGDRLTGLLSSLLAVISFNFFFTDPRYTFVVADSSYLITFPVMLVVAFVTSELTTRLQASAALARERQRRAEVLYRNSEQLISARTPTEIARTATDNLNRLIDNSITVILDGVPPAPETGSPTDTPAIAIATDETVFGRIVVEERETSLSLGQRALLNALAAQLAIALDRERLTQAEEQARLHAERERVRANLLRSVSHDLRTPLTAIAGAASALMELDETPDSHRHLPENIYRDAMWLSEIVENILSLTRLNDSRVALRRTTEVLEDIVLETVERMRRRYPDRTIELSFPPEIILVEVDPPLFGQLCTNVIANAIDFSPPDEAVVVSVAYRADQSVEIAVIDRGPGMSADVRDSAFELFFTQKAGEDSRRGLGVGLTIARTVAQLHGGTVVLEDNHPTGCVARISLPAVVAVPSEQPVPEATP